MLKKELNINYYNRYSGEVETEIVHASAFLNWCYNYKLGNIFTNFIFSRRMFSKVYGKIHNLKISRRKIEPFIRKHSINSEESTKRIDEYSSFNDFFKRKLLPGKRKIIEDEFHCIAPADGKYLAYENVNLTDRIQIKRHIFSLKELVKDDNMILDFESVSVLICRLHLSDYHRFHFPVNGIPGKFEEIKGRYHASGPYSKKKFMSGFSENYRVRTKINSDRFGRFLMIEVGAMTVGSIQQTYLENSYVKKGMEKGYFELGGSTIVLLFEKNSITIDKDLIENTSKNLETFIKMGDSIGKSTKISKEHY